MDKLFMLRARAGDLFPAGKAPALSGLPSLSGFGAMDGGIPMEHEMQPDAEISPRYFLYLPVRLTATVKGEENGVLRPAHPPVTADGFGRFLTDFIAEMQPHRPLRQGPEQRFERPLRP